MIKQGCEVHIPIMILPILDIMSMAYAPISGSGNIAQQWHSDPVGMSDSLALEHGLFVRLWAEYRAYVARLIFVYKYEESRIHSNVIWGFFKPLIHSFRHSFWDRLISILDLFGCSRAAPLLSEPLKKIRLYLQNETSPFMQCRAYRYLHSLQTFYSYF